MTVFFISDLHLDDQHPEMTGIFLKFLQSITHSEHTLYILGDFFEAWIGDDDLSPFNLSIIQALRKAVDAGLTIYFMHGNRDFLIGKKFLRATGCQLLPEEYVVNINGTPILLMHGDSLCTLDLKYMAFRKKSRTWLYQKLVLLKSLKSRRAIVAKMRAASREHVKTLASYIMDVTPAEVERVMKKHNVQYLIHGHTHRQDIHTLNVGNTTATRTVLGAWHETGNAFVCEENGDKRFIELS